jgi:hypothetical protein
MMILIAMTRYTIAIVVFQITDLYGGLKKTNLTDKYNIMFYVYDLANHVVKMTYWHICFTS